MPRLSAFLTPILAETPLVAAASFGAGLLVAYGLHRRDRVVEENRLGGVLAREEPEPCDL